MFAKYFLDVSNFELFEIMDKNKGIFFMRRRRLGLLEGKAFEVERTHIYILKLQS